ncbi:uncharacterized protein LOC130648942 [Hydractinia symbiolongicarpus]|uniref:uncharacterized protein LOC130648942 n=1 Tax=Hydractinia symbiolongicarpus TaxID=13093 RepID=UPI00254CE021|nr:uncharacterized protein LOC130648942 [Hydractinia symbiolongicarpus]
MSITLYHYTDTDGRQGIQSSGRIKMSDRSNDMRYGKGVYFTSIPPSVPKQLIAANNYDGRSNAAANRMMNAGRVDNYVAVQFNANDPNLKQAPSDRNVFLYKKDINLHQFHHNFGEA